MIYGIRARLRLASLSSQSRLIDTYCSVLTIQGLCTLAPLSKQKALTQLTLQTGNHWVCHNIQYRHDQCFWWGLEVGVGVPYKPS